MPTIMTRGALTAQGYGFGASSAQSTATYIEDVFSPYIYTGTSAARTITNNIDLSAKGGLVWVKGRDSYNHNLFDTARGATNYLHTNTSGAQGADTDAVTAFGSAGFSLGTGATVADQVNSSGDNFIAWTFRKQPKFFDVVTYTGTGSNTTVAHNLGSVPGMIIVKRTDTTSNWQVYHRSLTSAAYAMQLNLTAAAASAPTVWNSTAPTSSVFSVGTDASVNANGGTYVAYLFAHDAGGFGAAGTDNVITCGSFTAVAGDYNIGFEPQYMFIRNSSVSIGEPNWHLMDNIRGFSMTQGNDLFANTAGTETNYWGGVIQPTATGFKLTTSSFTAGTYIYMAIRRGPMKTPTDATKVFSPILTSSASGTQQTTGFPVDFQFLEPTSNAGTDRVVVTRLIGVNTVSTTTTTSPRLTTNTTGAESTSLNISNDWSNTGYKISAGYGSISMAYWNLQRAPGFCDVVCYTGTGVARTVTHNLGVVPELIIIKARSSAGWNWPVYNSTLGNTKAALLNDTAGSYTGSTWWNNTSPTSSVFTVGTIGDTNNSGTTFVSYLFATLAGISKVGSYTGTGAAQNIDCGFASSARFIMIKRTDNTGDWYCYDSARGISVSSDPYLFINTTAAQVTGTDYINPYSTGFSLTSTAPAGLNANGGTYLFLAIA